MITTNLSPAPSPAVDDLYSHIAPTPLLSPHLSIDLIDDEAAVERVEDVEYGVEPPSQFAEQEDSVAFLRALKGTKLPVIALVPNVSVLQGTSTDKKLAVSPEEEHVGEWGGIKLAGWNDAESGNGHGLENWISRDDDEEEEDSADD